MGDDVDDDHDCDDDENIVENIINQTQSALTTTYEQQNYSIVQLIYTCI